MNVPTYVAGNRLSELLTKVASGAKITVAKRGVPVANLFPTAPAFEREKARRAAASLREASKGAPLGGLKIKNLVDGGRS